MRCERGERGWTDFEDLEVRLEYDLRSEWWCRCVDELEEEAEVCEEAAHVHVAAGRKVSLVHNKGEINVLERLRGKRPVFQLDRKRLEKRRYPVQNDL